MECDVRRDLAANILPIENYDAAEAEARLDLSHEEIMAFASRTFSLIGFPDRIKVERELFRYADWIRDPGNQQYFKPGQFLRGPSVQTDFTPDEATLLSWICDQVVAMTGLRAGRAVRPLCNPFAHIGLFRVVEALKQAYGVQHLSIFEVGPGTAYLGAMLASKGDSYSSMDNAQAFYLFQNRLMAHVVGEDFAEWGHPDCVGYRKIARVTHIPWWEYLQLAEACPFQADIVISNANLGEMSRDAMKFVLRVSDRMLAKSPVGLFLFSDLGMPAQSNFDSVDDEFLNLGYRRFFERQFYAYGRKSQLPPARAAFLETRIPLYNPSNRLERKTAGEIAYLPDDQKPLGLNFVKLIEGWTPPVGEKPQTF